jgi:hypothetical protein
MSAAIEDPTWFKVLLAVRWPVAVVASSALLGGVLLQVLSRPIPIRLAMPLDQPLAVKAQVEELARPIKVDQLDDKIGIDLDEMVTVRGSVVIETPNPVPISGEPRVVVSSPVEVKAAAPLPVQGVVDVRADQPLPVQADVEVATPRPIDVDANVRIDSADSPVQIRLKGGLFGLF